MLSRKQIIHIKRAQHQAGIGDPEYRDTLEQLCGVRSSKDPKLTDGQFDQIMAYFEAIYWCGVDAGELPSPESCITLSRRTPVFNLRGYWQRKNPKHNTSRDRYSARDLAADILELEEELLAAGVSDPYLTAIKRKTGASERHYAAALRRTIAARRTYADIPADRRPF